MDTSDDLLQGRFRILKTISEGASWVVYLAEDLSFPHLRRAIKEIRTAGLSPLDAEEYLSLFETQKDILQSLNHPSLPKFASSFSSGSSHYIVMEYVQGETLDDIMKRNNRPFTVDEVLPLSLEIAKVLKYIHDQKPHPIIMRDLKPSNIILTDSGRISIIDFGIARYYQLEMKSDTQFYETSAFAAPEQFGTSQSDARSDIFSFGATLYHLLTREDLSKFNLNLPPLREYLPGVPRRFEEIIMHCVSKKPRDRFHSMMAVINAIESMIHLRIPTAIKGLIKVAMWIWLLLAGLLIISKYSGLWFENPKIEYLSNIPLYLGPLILFILLLDGKWNVARLIGVFLLSPLVMAMLGGLFESLIGSGPLVLSGQYQYRDYPYKEVVKKISFHGSNLVLDRRHGGAMDTFHIWIYHETRISPGLKRVRLIHSLDDTYFGDIEIIDNNHVRCYYAPGLESSENFSKIQAAQLVLKIDSVF